jgi:hypothetical protein
MRSAYRNCRNLTGSPVCGDKVTDMGTAYELCKNLVGPAICGSNVQSVYATYYGCSNLTGNAYFYSNQISNADSCFQNINTSKMLNIYVPSNSISLNTLLYNNTTSLVGANITYTNDTVNNCYYNTQYNIYIHPVENVAAARAANGD